MISYGYPSCASCHVSVQGRGLLNSYGRGIDAAQSYSKRDLTAFLLGRASDGAESGEAWDGRIGQVLADFLITLRLNQHLDAEKTDPAIAALYRQVVFLGDDQFRINTEFGLVDGGLHHAPLGSHLSATGGENLFLKKLTFEWRIEADDTSGKELVVGRDYLPLGLQIDDYTSYILHLNRSGIYDFPLQLKYFAWSEKSLISAFIFAPTFNERADHREYGAGFLYERYPTSNVALGLQSVAGWSEQSDRLRIGPYLRWGISEKWALLAEVDYGVFWNVEAVQEEASQVTSYLQLFHHHYEWLVSSVTANYAYSDALTSKDHLASFRYTISARLNRNVSVGATYAFGDILRNLGEARELGVFTTIKF